MTDEFLIQKAIVDNHNELKEVNERLTHAILTLNERLTVIEKNQTEDREWLEIMDKSIKELRGVKESRKEIPVKNLWERIFK